MSVRKFTCPQCGNDDRRKIQEVDDKEETPLYYSMQGQPVYPKKLHCGKCSYEWKKSS